MGDQLTGHPYPLSTRATALYLVQFGRCFHCRERMRFYPHTRKTASDGWTFEHVIPLSKGGGRHRNLVLAHMECNARRGDKPLEAADMLRATNIWEREEKIPLKFIQNVASDPTLRGTYLAAFKWSSIPS